MEIHIKICIPCSKLDTVIHQVIFITCVNFKLMCIIHLVADLAPANLFIINIIMPYSNHISCFLLKISLSISSPFYKSKLGSILAEKILLHTIIDVNVGILLHGSLTRA
jgi:hypothetical protein